MSELDPQNIVVVDPVEPTETLVIAEPSLFLVPANRPRKVYAGMWGPPEIAAVAASSLIFVLVVVIYFFWVVPSSRELAENRSQADRLEAELISAKTKYGEITDTETQVARIVTSVDDFETRFLPITSTGQSALYQRINGLIASYGLVNTTGPDYSPLETADQDSSQQSDDEKGRSKYRSLYPGVYVSTTVEGSYQNLRRFIRAIETGREFIIVSTVELAPSDSQNEGGDTSAAPNVVQINPTVVRPNSGGFPGGMNPQVVQNQPQQRPRPKGKTQGEVVSLHIEMAAYFRRPNIAAVQ